MKLRAKCMNQLDKLIPLSWKDRTVPMMGERLDQTIPQVFCVCFLNVADRPPENSRFIVQTDKLFE